MILVVSLLAGDHEYIDVVNYNNSGSSERLIIDIDFRSHFEIARAVQSYNRILNSLPVVYVGSLTKLKQFLQVMAEAGRSSLKQNSMPLPPWRSLAYLQAKWQSPYQRQFNSEEQASSKTTISSEHKRCSGHLKRLQSLLQSEIEVERLLKPINSDNNSSRRLKIDRWRLSSFRTLWDVQILALWKCCYSVVECHFLKVGRIRRSVFLDIVSSNKFFEAERRLFGFIIYQPQIVITRKITHLGMFFWYPTEVLRRYTFFSFRLTGWHLLHYGVFISRDVTFFSIKSVFLACL